MQTFLPYADFETTAECLDYRRLGKQRCEAWQIYQCLTGQGSLRWKNHPAVKMWKGYEDCLAKYFNCIVLEWINRGYNNNMRLIQTPSYQKIPSWLGNENLHASHRSNLLRKNPDYYGKFDWKESSNLPYIWPI